MGHLVNVSECARMYARSRKWVDNRLKKHNISTEQPADSTYKRFQLVDFIAHCGEPENNGTTPGAAPPNESEQSSTLNGTLNETSLLRQENQFLTKRIAELEGSLALQHQRETWLQGIIDRQLPALPKPKGSGVFRRLIGWYQGVKSPQ